MFTPRVAKADPAARPADPRSAVLQTQPAQEEAEHSAPVPGARDLTGIPALPPGRPLDLAARRLFESRFGEDFSRVRIHSDAHTASALGARAYTVGETIVFNEAEYSPDSRSGRYLLAHELAHVVQQRRGGECAAMAGDPNLESAAANAADAVSRGAPVTVGRAGAVGIARQAQNAGTGNAAAQPVGDASRPAVDALLTSFAAASGAEKNRIGMQAVREVIAAYRFSTMGLAEMHYEPTMSKFDALTTGLGGAGRRSRIEFGPGSFNQGFEAFVHVVAHELEHVAQNLVGDYRAISDKPGDSVVQEFLAYSGSVLQVAPVAIQGRRGLLGELRTPTPAPALPALPAGQLAGEAGAALAKWMQLSAEEQRRYWPQFESTRDKLLERISNDAPRALRPPTPDRTSPAFAQWRDGVPSVYDPLSPDYDPDVANSPWSKVKDQWKKYDAAKPPPPARTTPRPIGGVVADATGTGAETAEATV